MEDKSMEINDIIEKIHQCEEETGKGIIGQKDIIRQVMLAILAGGNVLLEGVPGLGKTQLVKTISRVMNMSFSRIQFTPDLMPADVTGTHLIIHENGQNRFHFEQGPVFANIVLADEINRATPKTQSALLEAMQEHTVTSGKQTWKLPSPFFVLATQNPIENEGTYPLPEAQLDRFLFKISVQFPSLEELKKIMDITVTGFEPEICPVVSGDDILAMQRMICDMPMADAVAMYALRLVVATHPESADCAPAAAKYIQNGASPRAAQAIFKTAKARALMEGRLNVSFEDVEYVAFPAMRHRIIPNFDAISEGVDNDTIIREIIDSVERF